MVPHLDIVIWGFIGLSIVCFMAYLMWPRLTRVSSSACGWHKDRQQAHGETTRWVCNKCGESGHTLDDRAPLTCKRQLKSAL